MSKITTLNIQDGYKTHIYTPLINYPPAYAFSSRLNFFFGRPFAYAYAHFMALRHHPDRSATTKAKNIFFLMLQIVPIFNILPTLAEHALNNYLERKFENLNTKAFLSIFNKHVRHIKTNIRSSSLSKILSQAQVIFLSDLHDVLFYKKIHGFVINALWQPGSRILSEELEVMTEHVNVEYTRSEMLWDLEEKELPFDGEQENLHLIGAASSLKEFFFEWKNAALSESLIEKYNKISMFLFEIKKSLNLAYENKLFLLDVSQDFLKMKWPALQELLMSWRTAYFEVLKKSLIASDDASPLFYQRNVSLVKNVIDQVEQGVSKIFLMAGKAHLQYSGSHYDQKNAILVDRAVDLVFSALNEKRISYVHLSPRKKPVSISDSDLDKWKPRPPDYRSKNKLTPLDQLNPHSDNKQEFHSLEEWMSAFEWQWNDYEKKAQEDRATNIDIIVLARSSHRMIKRMQQEIEALSHEKSEV